METRKEPDQEEMVNSTRDRSRAIFQAYVTAGCPEKLKLHVNDQIIHLINGLEVTPEQYELHKAIPTYPLKEKS